MMEKREKRKRIFYVPGMISLVLIPLFCFYHFSKIDAFKVYGALDFSVQKKEEFDKYKIADLRKYQVFDFNNKKAEELQNLKELRSFVKDLAIRYDTINGAKIHFGPKTDYNTFVSVINVMVEEKISTWIFYQNDIYAISGSKPRPNKNTLRIMSCDYERVNKEIWFQNELEIRKAHVVSLYKQYWILFLGYFGIVLLNIFTLVKFNKNKKYNQK